MNYKDDIRIDESALDVEWLRQAELTAKYGMQLADANQQVAIKKEALELCKAELDKAIRINPEQFEIAKITETVVLTTILSQEDYKSANAEYIEAKYEQDAAQAIVWALRDKKDALDNLVKLNGQQYFAGPINPRNLTEEREEYQRKVNAKIKINRK